MLLYIYYIILLIELLQSQRNQYPARSLCRYRRCLKTAFLISAFIAGAVTPSASF